MDQSEYAAISAWARVSPESFEATSITLLHREKKSIVYRIESPAGAAVIAKRCPKLTAALERTIYEEVLPHLPVTTLRYYGSSQEPDADF